MPKTYSFPMPALRALIKKSIMFMPTEQRKPLNEHLRNPAYKNAFEEKAQRLVVVIMKAKNCETEQEFDEEIREGLEFKLSTSEFYLFDGFLGGQRNLVLDFVKKGISEQRMAKIRNAIRAAAGVPTA